MSGNDADDKRSEMNSEVKAKDIINVLENVMEERPRRSSKNKLDYMKSKAQQKEKALQQEEDSDSDSLNLGKVCANMPYRTCTEQLDSEYLSRLLQDYISDDHNTSDSDSSYIVILHQKIMMNRTLRHILTAKMTTKIIPPLVVLSSWIQNLGATSIIIKGQR